MLLFASIFYCINFLYILTPIFHYKPPLSREMENSIWFINTLLFLSFSSMIQTVLHTPFCWCNWSVQCFNSMWGYINLCLKFHRRESFNSSAICSAWLGLKHRRAKQLQSIVQASRFDFRISLLTPHFLFFSHLAFLHSWLTSILLPKV